jgi:hypothetical protein
LFDSFKNHYHFRFLMTEHNEFPPLTSEAQKVLEVSFDSIDVSKPGWNRRFAAFVIREAVRQAGTFTVGTGLKGEVVEVVTLNCIANSLHHAPELPLKKQALDIWGEVEGEVGYLQAQIMRSALALIPDSTP